MYQITSRYRPKSAPYPRLKNSKKTSKCQVFFYSTQKLHTQKNGPSGAPGPASASPWRAKVSQCRKNCKAGPFGIFQHPFRRKTAKKIEGGTLWEKFFSKKKSRSAEKNERGTLWSRPVWYVTRKNRKTFLVQFARPNSAIWCKDIL